MTCCGLLSDGGCVVFDAGELFLACCGLLLSDGSCAFFDAGTVTRASFGMHFCLPTAAELLLLSPPLIKSLLDALPRNALDFAIAAGEVVT